MAAVAPHSFTAGGKGPKTGAKKRRSAISRERGAKLNKRTGHGPSAPPTSAPPTSTPPTAAATQQRVKQQVEYELWDTNLDLDTNGHLNAAIREFRGLSSEEKLTLFRTVIETKAELVGGESAFCAIVARIFWRLPGVKHGSLQRTVKTLEEKYRKKFVEQGSGTSEEHDTAVSRRFNS